MEYRPSDEMNFSQGLTTETLSIETLLLSLCIGSIPLLTRINTPAKSVLAKYALNAIMV